MGVLRTEHQATLADLHGHGEELLQRYRAAAQREGLAGSLRGTLLRTAAQREVLLQALAQRERAGDDLPRAGNVERATMAEVVDRLSRTLGEEQALAERLADGDRQWLDEAEHAMTLEWSADDAALIERIAAHLRESLQALQAI